GAHTAGPIWTGFMKTARTLPAYRDVKPFTPPDGVVVRNLDKITNRIATATCPDDYTASFIAGTEPKETCDQQPGDQRGFFQKLLGLGPKPSPPPAVSNPSQTPAQPGQQQNSQAAQQQQEDPNKKKKGFFGKIFGAFKDDKKEDNKSEQKPEQKNEKQDPSKPANPPPQSKPK